MSFTSILLTILWLVIIPVWVGGIFSFRNKGFVFEGCSNEGNGYKQTGIIIWSWFLGQLLLWCAFQFITVWIILHKNRFEFVVKYYTICVAVLCVISLVVNVVRIIRKKSIFSSGVSADSVESRFNSVKGEDTSKDKKLITVAWIVFGIVLLLQVVLQSVFSYMDADDAYYVSEAVAIESSNNMYRFIPYTGMTTDMDYRHSLEPFPAWVAFISKITGTKVVSMAHILLPTFFLPLTYGVYAIMGSRILAKNKSKLPIYLIIIEILVMFSLYSSKVPEKFFITRIRQGKATITSLIIPGIILCLFLILEYARDKRRTDIAVWIMLFMLSAAGCLCSTLGALLCVVPVALVAIMMIFAYKTGRQLLPMFLGCMPCFVFAVLYIINQ